MKQTKRAFTIIEVLVVMILIGVLSAAGGIYYYRMNKRSIGLKAREDASNVANLINNLYKTGSISGQITWSRKGSYPNYHEFINSSRDGIGQQVSRYYFNDDNTIKTLNRHQLTVYLNNPQKAVDDHSEKTVFYYPIYRNIDTTNDCDHQDDCNEIQLYYIDNDGVNYSFKMAKKAASGVLINE